MNNLNIGIIIGTTREGRFGDKPARWIYEEIQKLDGVHAELLDLRDYPLPLFAEVAPPMALEGKYASEVAGLWAQKVAEFDGFIMVTGEYNHGYPAVLKNALDYAYAEWNKKPVSFVSYGYADGVRAVEQLRQVVIQLDMVPVSSALHIPDFWTRSTDQGTFKPDGLTEKLPHFFGELLWWTRATKAAKASGK